MSAIAAVATALLVAAPAAPTFAADDAQAEVETREVVDLELKIATEGRAVGSLTRLVELDKDTSLALQADGHEHAVDINVRKVDDKGKKLSVTLGYQVDGEAVMESVTLEAAAKKAKVVRSDSGQVALSLKLAPKVVSVDELPPPRRHVDIVEGTDDPLAGL